MGSNSTLSTSRIANLSFIFVSILLCVVVNGVPHHHHHRQHRLKQILRDRSDYNSTLAQETYPTTSNGNNNTSTGIPPQWDIDAVSKRVSNGLRTILNGISNFRLSEILRGSFMFTRHEPTRKIANEVIDTIFGPRNVTKSDVGGQGVFPLTAI